MKTQLLLIIILASASFGCASKPKPKPIEWTPVNPDIPAVVEPVKSARAGTDRAGAAAKRAVQIIEKIVPSPAQAAQISALRLELATTLDELRLTSEQLDNALLRIPQIEKQVADMKAWGLEQNRQLGAAVAAVAAERERADRQHAKARRIASERDLFVNLFAVAITVAGLIALVPLIRAVSEAAGPWQPAAAIGGFLLVSGGLYFGAFWLIRLLLSFLS